MRKILSPNSITPQTVALLVSGSPVGVSASLLRELASRSDFILALDSGGEQLMRANLIPDLLVGDFDSIKPDTLAWCEERNVPTQTYDRYKNATDLELGMEALRSCGFCRLIASNVLGGRTDHALGALAALAKAATCGMEVVLRDQNECCYFVSGNAGAGVLELEFTGASEAGASAGGAPRDSANALAGGASEDTPAMPAGGASEAGLPDAPAEAGHLHRAANLPLLTTPPPPKQISLIAWGNPATVSLTGTEWELDQYILSPLSALGVSNAMRLPWLRLTIHEGCGTVLLLLEY
jgi:thiamine pyrophosphokinase